MSNTTVKEIPLKDLVAHPENLRGDIDEDHPDFKSLVTSLRTIGQRVPAQGRQTKDGIVLTAGHRRLAAAKKAKLATLRVEVTSTSKAEFKPDGDDFVTMLAENELREGLPTHKKIRASAELVDVWENTNKEVAASMGVSPATVSRYLSIAKLPDAVIEHVDLAPLEKWVKLSNVWGSVPDGQKTKFVELLDTQDHIGESAASGWEHDDDDDEPQESYSSRRQRLEGDMTVKEKIDSLLRAVHKKAEQVRVKDILAGYPDVTVFWSEGRALAAAPDGFTTKRVKELDPGTIAAAGVEMLLVELPKRYDPTTTISVIEFVTGVNVAQQEKSRQAAQDKEIEGRRAAAVTNNKWAIAAQRTIGSASQKELLELALAAGTTYAVNLDSHQKERLLEQLGMPGDMDAKAFSEWAHSKAGRLQLAARLMFGQIQHGLRVKEYQVKPAEVAKYDKKPPAFLTEYFGDAHAELEAELAAAAAEGSDDQEAGDE